MKNVFITGCNSGLGKSFLQESTNYNLKAFPHFRNNEDYDGNCLVGDLNIDLINNVKSFLLENDIDIFINNAGVYGSGKIQDMDNYQILNILENNLFYSILMIKMVYSYFEEKGKGIIVNINSIASLDPKEYESVYSASKAGLRAFSTALQKESHGKNIEFLDVFPGAMKTKMTLGRSNYENLMEPSDVAKIVYDNICNDKNVKITDLVIRRK
jgi:short-subunit dehydrogenase